MKTFIKVTRKIAEDDKLAPQQRVIIETVIEKSGGVGKKLERSDLIDELTSNKKLNTRQDPGRVVSFYQPKLQEMGLIEVTKESEKETKPSAKKAGEKDAGKGEPGKAPAKAS